MKEDKLNQLFSSVQSSPSEQSFRDASRQFLKAKGVGFFEVILISWGLLAKPLKLIIMISTILSASTLITILLLPSQLEAPPQFTAAHTTELENKEIDVDSEGNTSITYYDNAKKVVKKELIPGKKHAMALEKLETKPLEEMATSNESQTLIPIAPPRADDSTSLKTTTKTFVIERNMPDSKLQAIQDQATAAGIKFRYKILVWKGKTKRIDFSMKLSTENSTCDYDSQLTGNFRKTIGWVENADGKAIALLD